MKEMQINSPEQMRGAADALLAVAGDRRVIALQGPVGAGKTTLVQAFCRALGVAGEVTSPTYALVNEYVGKDGLIYHLDLYRLGALDEALEIGLEELIDSGNWCLIEWPELIEPLLPPDALAIKLEIVDESTRKVIFL